jgi:putative ABC transport system substrate-binding protein
VGAILVLSLASCGPGASENVSVGILNLVPDLDIVYNGFQASMTELGYTEGENITYVYNGATGNPADLAGAAQALVDAQVDLIFCITTPACMAAQQATAGTGMPVVFSAVTDPLAVGLVKDYAQPGGNVTGVTVGARNFVNEGRRLGWLVQTDPTIERVYIPYNPQDNIVAASLAAVSADAAGLGVELVLAEVRTSTEVQAALDAMPQDVDALFVFADVVVTADFQLLIDAAIGRGIPFATPNSIGPQQGALMSYGSDFTAIGSQAARLTDQVIKGTQPADLPVEVPEFFLIVNADTAGRIGLEIPEDVLKAADQVIR